MFALLIWILLQLDVLYTPGHLAYIPSSVKHQPSSQAKGWAGYPRSQVKSFISVGASPQPSWSKTPWGDMMPHLSPTGNPIAVSLGFKNTMWYFKPEFILDNVCAKHGVVNFYTIVFYEAIRVCRTFLVSPEYLHQNIRVLCCFLNHILGIFLLEYSVWIWKKKNSFGMLYWLELHWKFNRVYLFSKFL